MGSSDREVFLEIKLYQKKLTLYTSWVHWKNQRRSTIRKHVLLRNKNEYQHSADIFDKNIFNPFHDTGLLLYSPKYISNVFRGQRKRPLPWNVFKTKCMKESLNLQLLILLLIQVTEDSLHSWQRLPKTPIFERPPISPTPFFKFCSTPQAILAQSHSFCCLLSLNDWVIAQYLLCYFT